MTIIVFLIDTSASMHQKTYLAGRSSLLDVAKNIVEIFVKVRQRNQESRGDRYMLLSFEEPPTNIKAGWKENLLVFMNELKNLQCFDLTSTGNALKNTFDFLNLNRIQNGIDTYGQGRHPFFLEPTIVLLITDGGKLSSTAGIVNELNIPMHASVLGTELTQEPFRWDQRLFALVLRLTGTPANEKDIGLIPKDYSVIDPMCEATGGRSYCITSHKTMMQCIESVVLKLQSGVVINFEKIDFDSSNSDDVLANKPNDTESRKLILPNDKEYSLSTSNTKNSSWQYCRKMILVPRSAQKGFAVGFWPIPESFWPDSNILTLPARSAHPFVKFSCIDQGPMSLGNLPFDKYELEPSPLTQFILARKKSTTCWQVFVSNSCKNTGIGYPFGYLKAKTNLKCVNLFVMPYNYPALIPLLNELFEDTCLKPTPEWIKRFNKYLSTVPSYYITPLRKALLRMEIPDSLIQILIPESYDFMFSSPVLSYFRKIKKQAKIEFDRLCNDMMVKTMKSKNKSRKPKTTELRIIPRNALKREIVTHPNFTSDSLTSVNDTMHDYTGFVVQLPRPRNRTSSYQNYLDIQRSNLLDQMIRMRANYFQSINRTKLFDDDVAHTLPVSEMGNYHDYLKRMPAPLRQIENTPIRVQMFGNPFKIDKRVMVDEADIDLIDGPVNDRNNKRKYNETDFKQLPVKRKPGPIPPEVIVKRPFSFKQSKYNPQSNCSASHPQINGDKLDVDEAKNENNACIKQTPVDNMLPALENTPNGTHYNILPKECASEKNSKRIKNAVQIVNSLSEDDLEIIKYNKTIKRMLFSDVRRPGKNYQPLFDHLQLLKGDFHVQEVIIKQVRNESLRFRRRILAEKISHFLEKKRLFV